MKRTNRFVKKRGVVRCVVSQGVEVEVPVFPGILKHPTLDVLRELLQKPEVLKKYTIEALRCAPWPVIRQFPRQLLFDCMKEANIAPGRLRALEFMLT